MELGLLSVNIFPIAGLRALDHQGGYQIMIFGNDLE
jgi:hypothetical protein